MLCFVALFDLEITTWKMGAKAHKKGKAGKRGTGETQKLFAFLFFISSF